MSRYCRSRAPPPPSPPRIGEQGRCAPLPASAPGSPQTAARAGNQPSGGVALRLDPSTAGGLREVADAADVGLALGDADHAPRLQRVEDVARLDRLLIGWDRQFGFKAALALGGRLPKGVEQ